MRKFSITTFGCQMNVHDSEKMAGLLSKSGFSPTDDQNEADVIILNTCSIRHKAEHKFLTELGMIKALKKKHPNLKVVVAGCVAQQMGKSLLKRAPHVDIVIGPQNIQAISALLESSERQSATYDNPNLALTELPSLRKEKGRAWVNIMYGCNNFCSYCIVPYTRGREVSRLSKSIIKEITGLASEGFKEVTLLGQNVNSYKSDIDFPGLLKKVNDIEGIERIRFVTSHPRDLSDSLIEAMHTLDKVCEHIHLPLQSGSTRVLKLMNRGYSLEEYKAKVNKLRDIILGIAVTTDIITGFPGETDEDHEATANALREIQYDGIFGFKYSPRPGTKASTMEGHLPENVSNDRLNGLLELQDGITLNINRLLEFNKVEVLVEGRSETNTDKYSGRTRNNKIVNFSSPVSLENGELVMVKIIEGKKHSLSGVFENK